MRETQKARRFLGEHDFQRKVDAGGSTLICCMKGEKAPQCLQPKREEKGNSAAELGTGQNQAVLRCKQYKEERPQKQ